MLFWFIFCAAAITLACLIGYFKYCNDLIDNIQTGMLVLMACFLPIFIFGAIVPCITFDNIPSKTATVVLAEHELVPVESEKFAYIQLDKNNCYTISVAYYDEDTNSYNIFKVEHPQIHYITNSDDSRVIQKKMSMRAPWKYCSLIEREITEIYIPLDSIAIRG